MNVKFTGKIIAAGQVQMGTSQNGTQWSSCEYTIEELSLIHISEPTRPY